MKRHRFLMQVIPVLLFGALWIQLPPTAIAAAAEFAAHKKSYVKRREAYNDKA